MDAQAALRHSHNMQTHWKTRLRGVLGRYSQLRREKLSRAVPRPDEPRVSPVLGEVLRSGFPRVLGHMNVDGWAGLANRAQFIERDERAYVW